LTFCLAWSQTVSAGGPTAAAIASAHPLATQAGVEILAAKGNAFDAAVAVTAALAVVEPYASGLGGGGFWLLHREADGFEVMVDGRETAPGAAKPDKYLDHAGNPSKLSIDGPLAVAIPGVPAGIDHLARRYGRLPLSRSLAPAIRLARQGFPATRRYREMAELRLDALKNSPAAAIFLKENQVPPIGHLLVQPDLASTLETIAREGADGFYHGPLGERLVAGIRAAGGLWTREDLASYRVVERKPIIGSYRGIRVVSAPPPSSGGTVLLEILNILEGDDLNTLDRVSRAHLLIEAMRRAYRDRALHLGDPDFVAVPTTRLLDKGYAAQLRSSISLSKATPSDSLWSNPNLHREAANTSHFSILDGEGNRVAATLSINYPFGSGFVAPSTGILLNDEMDDFAISPGRPNVYGLMGGRANRIASGKRPLSSMSPTFLETPGRVAILGTPGGSRIISMVLLAVLDFAVDRPPLSWVSLPRFHHQYLPDRVEYEPGVFSELEAASLRRLGHQLQELEQPYGNMQAVLWAKSKGLVEAASDPRGEGAAIVLPNPVEEGDREAVHFGENCNNRNLK
jgi:gamma-glutamyltranspeptidase/glutathione hydrolase